MVHLGRAPSRVVRAVLVLAMLAAYWVGTPLASTACEPPLTPFNMTVIGHSGGIFGSVATTDTYVLAVRGSALVAYDTSAGALTPAGAAPAPESGGSLFVDGERAYVVGANRFGIYDIADPAAPVLLGVAEMPSVEYAITGFFACGDRAYAGYEKYDTFGTKVFDVTDPVAPTVVAYSGLVLTDMAPDVVGSWVYAVAGDGTVDVIDISDADAPEVTTSVGANVADAAVSGSELYLSLDTGLLGGVSVFGLADPGAPAMLGTVVGDEGTSLSAAGDRLWRVSGGLLELWDTTDKDTPVLVETDAVADAVYVAAAPDAEHAYVVEIDSSTGNSILDGFETLSVPDADTLFAQVGSDAGDGGVAISGTLAYVAAPGGLRIIDLAAPGVPTTGTAVFAGDALDVAVLGDTVFVATEAGLSTVDASDPTSPVELDSIAVPGGLDRVAIDGDTAFGLTATDLYAFDVTDPAAIVARDSVAFADAATDLAVRDGRAWVTLDYLDGSGDLQEYDVSDPTGIAFSGEHGLPGSAPCVTVTTETAYVGLTDLSWGGSGTKIFDVSEPGALSYIQYHSLGQLVASDVDASDGELLSAGDGGVLLTGAYDPALAYSLGYLPVAGARVARSGELLAASAPGGGTTFMRYEPVSFRTFGGDRFDTAIAMSQTFDSSEYVVLATGRSYPDALAGVPLAYALDAPILLTEPTFIPDDVAAEIERLGATKAIVLGGTAAMGESIVTQLRGMGFAAGDIERISGATRYDTAHAIALRLEQIYGEGTIDTAFIATGKNFPDALAAAGAAAKAGCPVLLVRPDTSNTAAKTALAELGITNTVVVGGDAVIPASVTSALPSPERLAGANRYETAAEIARWSMDDPATAFDPGQLFVVTGLNFPDALSCGVVAAMNDAPTLLVGEDPPPATLEFVQDNAELIDAVQIIGGDAAVCSEVEQWIVSYVR